MDGSPSSSTVKESDERRRRRVRLWENLFQFALTAIAIVIGACWSASDERILTAFGLMPALAFGGISGLMAGLFVSGLILRILQYRRGA